MKNGHNKDGVKVKLVAFLVFLKLEFFIYPSQPSTPLNLG